MSLYAVCSSGMNSARRARVMNVRRNANGLQRDTHVSRALESPRGFERFVADLVSSLAKATAKDLDKRVRDGLGRLATRAGGERGSLARFTRGGDSLTVTHRFGADAIASPLRTDLRWYVEQLRRGRSVVLSRIPDDLPVQATDNGAMSHATRIRSHVAVPLFSAGLAWGAIALASTQHTRSWTSEDVRRLRLVGEIMMDAVQRHEAEQTSRGLRDQVAHVARIALLGNFTVAITHELKQPLTAMRANAQATMKLLARGAPLDEVDEALGDIVADSTRAADLIHRLAALMQRRQLQRMAVDVNQVVRDAHLIVRGEARRRGARIVLRLGPDLPRVSVDPVQIQQVLLNLIRNAAEAMANLEPEARIVEVSTTLTAPGRVTVSVTDAGPPIDDSVFNRLFRPFYTTKPDGLGMGLAISRSIVEAHGGRLWAERGALRGLNIHITLPALAAEDSTKVQ